MRVKWPDEAAAPPPRFPRPRAHEEGAGTASAPRPRRGSTSGDSLTMMAVGSARHRVKAEADGSAS